MCVFGASLCFGPSPSRRAFQLKLRPTSRALFSFSSLSSLSQKGDALHLSLVRLAQLFNSALQRNRAYPSEGSEEARVREPLSQISLSKETRSPSLPQPRSATGPHPALGSPYNIIQHAIYLPAPLLFSWTTSRSVKRQLVSDEKVS